LLKAPALEPDSFKLIAENRQQVNQVADAARKAIQAHCSDPVQLAGFMEHHQTPVFILNRPILGHLMLMMLGFELGFIPPSRGRRQAFLSRFLCKNTRRPAGRISGDMALEADLPYGVVVLTPSIFTMGYLSHQLHHWLACRAGLQGYSERAQRLYKQFWQKQKGNLERETAQLKIEDLHELKAAINRDMEALKFLQAMIGEIFIPAQQAKRLSEGSASI